MNKEEWKIIEKHTRKFCILTKLSKKHKFHLEPEECECSFHRMIKELIAEKSAKEKQENK